MLRHFSSTQNDMAATASRTSAAHGTGARPRTRTAWWTSERRELILAHGGFGAPGVAIDQLHRQRDVKADLLPPAAAGTSAASEIAERGALSRVRSGLAGIADCLLHVWKLVQREYRIACAVRQLERLDERMLRDIGISRYEIRRSARFGRDHDGGGA
ncbi:DUF1127 domain-containing protein [Amorphus orientalis]|uniref:Uncharacterized protein YjiS (DUF1127 family) n=1 Tax=Amorphus orientalis TaxID=649198 RepID=A0AAE3VMW2_9HYPH|nr:DUF1127 domain-containing protein [Amorphus orientalis]MDQ0314993.1 uncharacterized protein YjiS (DUF1127 family) [Amorphus orientalis]